MRMFVFYPQDGPKRKSVCSWPNCQKAFPAPALLKRHYTTHTGEKEFKCPCCDYASNQKWHLKSHILRKHLEFAHGLQSTV